jgi:hypothetical protein
MPNDRPGWFSASEFISVIFDGDVDKRLFAKHGPAFYNGYARGGLPGGMSYELSAHIAASQIRPDGIPALLGFATDADQMSIFLEVIEDALPIYQLPTLTAAAEWIGVFQHRSQVQDAAWRSLNSIDSGFLLQWADPAMRMIEQVDTDSVVPHTDLERGISLVHRQDVDLLGAPDVMIHGDYYAVNILHGAAGLSVVDWEMAAVGPGEMDLAIAMVYQGIHQTA